MTSRIRPYLASGGLLGAAGTYVLVGHGHQPIQHWFVWQLLALVLLASWFAGSCLAAGHVVLTKGLRLRFPLAEHLVLSFAAGVLLFALGVFSCGAVGALGTTFFVLFPTILALTCGPLLFRDARRVLERARALRCGRPWDSIWTRLVWGFGVLGFLLLYLQILTPANIAYDAQWYHLPLAERYAFTGAIGKTPEGWFQGTLPQLATWLFTWAFLVPNASLAFKLRLVGHIELALLVGTVAAVPVMARHLLPGRRLRGVWPVFFLFPGIFLYDSNLNGSADHVHAFWALPIALAFWRICQRPGWRRAVLFGAMLGGAVATKYQALYFIVGLAFLSAFHLVRLVRTKVLVTPFVGALGVAALALVLVTAPHWAKNWIQHQNPLYPFAHGWFGGSPWEPGTVVKIEDPGWRPEGSTSQMLLETLRGTFTFSLSSHDWYHFHRDRPVFGALFPLILIPLLASRKRHHVWPWATATFLGVATWFWTYHQDRYLQALTPWMAAIVAASLGALWSFPGRVVRGSVGALVAVQLVWGADVPFFPTHSMIGQSPYALTLALASSSFRKQPEEQHDPHTALPKVSKKIPKDAVVLVHDKHLLLGLRRRTISDTGGRQGGISYQNLATPAGVYDKFRSLGVSHILWTRHSDAFDTFASDLVFYDFVRHHTSPIQVEGFELSPLPDVRPKVGSHDLFAAIVDCSGVRAVTGPTELNQALSGRPAQGCDEGELLTLSQASLARAKFFVVPSAHAHRWHTRLADRGFLQILERNEWVAFSRREPAQEEGHE